MTSLDVAHASIRAALAHSAASAPDKVAVSRAGVQLTYAEWHARASRAATALAERTEPGAVVLVHLSEDRLDAVVGVVAAVLAGCRALPMSDRFAPAEVQRVADEYGARLVVVDDSTADRVAPAAGYEVVPLADLEASAPDEPADPEREPSGGCLVYTSGTTGMPRAVLCPYESLTYWLSWQPNYGRSGVLHPFPFDSSAGVGAIMFALTRGPVVQVPMFDAGAFTEAMRRFRPSELMVIPAQARTLTRPAARAALAQAGTESVATVTVTAAPADDQLVEDLRDLFPRAVVINSYSSTEAGSAATNLLYPPREPAGAGAGFPRPEVIEGAICVGYPNESTQIRILDEEMNPVPEGAVGEVWLRAADRTAREYASPLDPAERPVFQDGWVRTGDLGRLDRTGALHLAGRASDTINVGGRNVSAQEIEAALRRHPAVVDVAVVGVPEPGLGEEVAAVVVAQGLVRERDLRAFAAERLSPYQVPRHVLLAPALPMNAMGKVLKRELRAQLLELVRAGEPAAEPSAGTAPAGDVRQTVAAMWSQMLPAADPDANFFEVGTSLKALEMAVRLTDELGAEVSALDIFDFPTREALGAELARRAAEPDHHRPA